MVHEASMTLHTLRSLNGGRELLSCDDPDFREFGRVLSDRLPCKGLISRAISSGQFMETDGKSTRYIAESPVFDPYDDMTVRLEREAVSRQVFAEMPVQIGCCWGWNTRLNGMEYHGSSEVIVAVTDMILMLGRQQDIDHDPSSPTYGWDSSRTRWFFVPQGAVIELYATTLHLAPCRTRTDAQFCALILLPAGTNTPLEQGPDGTLWMKNKWMLAHPEGPAAARGAAILVHGENLEVIPAGPVT